MKRGQRFFHNHWVSPADNTPLLVQVTSTKENSHRDGTRCRSIYYRGVMTYTDGREKLGQLMWGGRV